MPNSINFCKMIFLHAIPVHIIVSWYDTAQTTCDAITFPIPRRLLKISSSFIYDKNWSNELTFLSAYNGSKSNSHNS